MIQMYNDAMGSSNSKINMRTVRTFLNNVVDGRETINSDETLRNAVLHLAKAPTLPYTLKYIEDAFGIKASILGVSSLLESFNGESLRNEVLKQASCIKYEDGKKRWVVIAYINSQPYSGATLSYFRNLLIVEHIVTYPMAVIANVLMKTLPVNLVLIEPAIEKILDDCRADIIYIVPNDPLFHKYGYERMALDSVLPYSYMKRTKYYK